MSFNKEPVKVIEIAVLDVSMMRPLQIKCTEAHLRPDHLSGSSLQILSKELARLILPKHFRVICFSSRKMHEC